MRKQLYKVDLWMSDGKNLPITIATSYIERLPTLVEKNKMYYNRPERQIIGWDLLDTHPTVNMSQQQYDNELTYVDVNDEED